MGLIVTAVVLGFVLALVSFSGIRSGPGADVSDELAVLRLDEAARTPQTTAATPALCHALAAMTTGRVTDDELDELSGLVRSQRTPGLFWAIEDSGAAPVFSALRGDGSSAGAWQVPAAENVDWEDLATGPGPGGPVLYAADIGDNRGRRDAITIYRVPEPLAAAGGGQTAPAARLVLRYPDGAHDAEALLIDPRRGTLLVITKGLTGGGVYALSAPLPFGGTATLRDAGAVPVSFATGADVSADGTTVAVRGYGALALWSRRSDEPLTQTLRRRPCISPTTFKDEQGEAIALSSSGTTAWTVSEGRDQPLLRFRRR